MGKVQTNYQFLILGGGPAGLAVGCGLEGTEDVLLVERGKSFELRDRDSEIDNASGIGGAGLYSDGKFSFFPSATELWNLPNKSLITKSLDWTTKLLELSCEEYESTKEAHQQPPQHLSSVNTWAQKHYPSFFRSLEQRQKITGRLWDTIKGSLLVETEVSAYQWDQNKNQWAVQLTCIITNNSKHIYAKHLVFCGGRMGPLLMKQQLPQASTTFRRLELGFRVSLPYSQLQMGQSKDVIDPKFLYFDDSNNVEFRTFCACQDGETVLTNVSNVWSVSGRSDCPPTGTSNIGFNARIKQSDCTLFLSNFPASYGDKSCYFSFPLDKFLGEDPHIISHLDSIYTSHITKVLIQGVTALMHRFPMIDPQTTKIVGPTIEGVGFYPNLSESLQYGDYPAWVCGDATGKFRGIIAGLISGYYIGQFLKDLVYQ